MTAMSLEDSFGFNIEVNYSESNPYPDHHSQPRAISDKPPPRKRRRIVISCTECHRRKQKCDRKLPCTNCISRHKEDDCQYDSGAPTAKEQQQHEQPKRARRISSDRGKLTPPVPGFDGITDSITDEHWPEESFPNDNHQNLPGNVSNAANLGYSTTGASTSTLGFLHKIENHSNSNSSPSSTTANNHDHRAPTTSTDHLNIRERFKSLIRQLPQRLYVEKLVDIYFRDFNWQYYMLDRDIFDQQLEEWYKVPFEVFINVGPRAISPDLRVFPALLFQVVAVTMLILPEKADKGGRKDGDTGNGDGVGRGEEHKSCRSKGTTTREDDGVDFETLKHAGNMTFDDLAKEYSEAGVAILALLGKRQMTLSTALAGFARASFLKFVGMVPEAWHAIGTAIRDAQELGLHRSSLDPRPPPSATAEAILQNQWEIQRRRKVWLNLVSWDIHCGATLGRPSTVDITTNPPILPIDVALRTGTTSPAPIPLIPRTEDDPPTPLTRILYTYNITLHLVSILSLERSAEGPSPSPSSPTSFAKVDALYSSLLSLESSIPSYFCLSKPDTRFDPLPSCHWLPWARALLSQLISFNFMALHRPYIFTRPLSRQLAVERGCLDMLKAQRRHWELLTPEVRRRTFTLFFGTFDAVILMGAVYILFPPKKLREDKAKEEGTKKRGREMMGERVREREKAEGREREREKEMVKEVVSQFKWAEERFEEMKEWNPLARQARGVVRGIGERLGRALGEVGVSLRDTALSRKGAAAVKPSVVAVAGRRKRLVKSGLAKPVPSTRNGLTPALSTSRPPGIGAASRGDSATTPAIVASTTPGFPTPESTGPSSLSQVQFSTETSGINFNTTAFSTPSIFPYDSAITFAECIPIDPSLNSNPVPTIFSGADVDWADASIMPSAMSLPSLPEDFNWTDISPLYATGDLVYNDLTGFMWDDFEPVVHTGDNRSHSMDVGHVSGMQNVREVGLGAGMLTDTQTHMDTGAHDAEGGMVELTRLENDDIQEQSEALWMFDGRIDEGSVWGLLKQY